MSAGAAGAAAGAQPAWTIWWHWVAANVAGEITGFGLAALAGAIVAPEILSRAGSAQALDMVGAVVLIGALEGTAVGLAQWLVLRSLWRVITWPVWTGATVAGAIAAWGSGMLIGSTLGDQLEALASGSPLVLALSIGLVAGTLLSVFQWLVLRRVTPAAGWWVPAHAVAWAAGMVVAFAGLGALTEETPLPIVAGVGAGTGLGMGALVATLTGLALVQLASQRLVTPASSRTVAARAALDRSPGEDDHGQPAVRRRSPHP